MRFLVDAQLPLVLAAYLRSAGHEAEHVLQIGRGEALDRDIRKYAGMTGAALITKDVDFLTLPRIGARPPAIVWVRLGNTRNASLIRAFEDVLPKLVVAIETGETLVEVR
jgi:predicted nuclease of predicted toxin-antitoxin system